MNLSNLRADLRVLEREIDRLLKSEALCCGVTMLQCHVLLELEAAEDISIKKLEENLKTDKAALSRTVEALVRDGLVLRHQKKEDRRFVRIELTRKGREKAAAINSSCNGSYTALFTHIPREKHENVAESIGLLARAMSELKKSEKSGDGGWCCIPTSQQT